ncbi:hypothetical protein [Aquimarina rubra]|uniref:SPOR domain-containing protein n=1 Tax=Aquimarina rubra TaxID=1920033 RepID=A0ABW5LKW7_9FLAO
MKQLNITILISFLLWSCIENNAKSDTISSKRIEKTIVEIETDTIELTKKVEPEKVDSISKRGISNAPCTELQEFVIDIEKIQWVSDTNRLKKVGIYGELERKKVKYFNGRPFYPINFENTQLNKTYNTDIFKSHFDSLDFKLFKGVKNIWGYFYRDKEASDWISDGVIEQWEFETENQADKALNQIMQPGFIVYFNTNPYFCRIRNKLMIFQSRAMAFSYDQKPIFEKFIKEKAPIMVYEQ